MENLWKYGIKETHPKSRPAFGESESLEISLSLVDVTDVADMSRDLRCNTIH